jgi:hypothetical protein
MTHQSFAAVPGVGKVRRWLELSAVLTAQTATPTSAAQSLESCEEHG